MIRYVLGNPPESADSWTEPQSGVIYRIGTPRVSNPHVTGKAFELEILTSLEPKEAAEEKDGDEKEYRALELSLETFNRDAMRKEFGDTNALDGLVAQCKASPASFACRVGKCYWAADDLSIHFSCQTRSTLLWILGFALTAVAGFEIYAHVFSTHFALWLVYPGALVGAWMVHRFTKQRRIETRYLDYRALAEALPVQFFWSLAGIHESVAEHYLVHHRTALDWIRYALRGIWLFQLLEGTDAGGSEKEARLVLEHWIQDQKGYYAKTSRKQKAALHRLERWSGGSLRGVWLLSLLIPISLLIPWDRLTAWRSIAAEEPWLGLLILLTTLPSITIGLIRVWMEQGGYEEQVATTSVWRMSSGARKSASRPIWQRTTRGRRRRASRMPATVFIVWGFRLLRKTGIGYCCIGRPPAESGGLMSGARIFISYSHRGNGPKWKAALLRALQIFDQHHLLDVWQDGKIRISSFWDDDIRQAINSASLAVLLLTPEALESAYILETEFPALRSRQHTDTLPIFPVVCDPCDWKAHDWLRATQAPNQSMQ